jgi:hypothetical protein
VPRRLLFGHDLHDALGVGLRTGGDELHGLREHERRVFGIGSMHVQWWAAVRAGSAVCGRLRLRCDVVLHGMLLERSVHDAFDERLRDERGCVFAVRYHDGGQLFRHRRVSVR